MEVEKKAYVGLIEYYKILPLKNKRIEIINDIEQLISNYSKICSKLGMVPNILLNKEMLNINREDLTEEEFLHAVYAYLNALQDISGQFIDKIGDMIENKN